MSCFNDTYQQVKEYYGSVLQKTSDLGTNVCMRTTAPHTKIVRDLLNSIHPEVISRYYGCGNPISECLDNMQVLDLGSGSGRDCFLLSKLVGHKGSVIGIDMTAEQVELARKYIDYHTEKYGYSSPNVSFLLGYIENLGEVGIKNEQFDLVISNGALNLSPDKMAVLKEAYRVLKFGSEFIISDICTDKCLSDDIRMNKELLGECLSGALWWEEFAETAVQAGFCTPRLISYYKFDITSSRLKALVGDAKFVSATYRLFKLPKGELLPGLVKYKGSIEGCSDNLVFDHRIAFQVNKPEIISGELLEFLKTSRYRWHFDFPDEETCSQNVYEGSSEVAVNPFI